MFSSSLDINSFLAEDGFRIVDDIYTKEEIDQLTFQIEQKALSNLFGVRAFLKTNPDLFDLVFNENLKDLIHLISPQSPMLIKSIYFDKPPSANWIVNWHQDLTINLKEKIVGSPYLFKRVNSERAVVQPPLEFLKKIFTIRIHLDDCNAKNGALRVLKGSHKNGIIEVSDWLTKNEMQNCVVCEAKKGSVLVMRPLILHSSKRTENSKNRRVLHLEFTAEKLPLGHEWNEAFVIESL